VASEQYSKLNTVSFPLSVYALLVNDLLELIESCYVYSMRPHFFSAIYATVLCKIFPEGYFDKKRDRLEID